METGRAEVKVGGGVVVVVGLSVGRIPPGQVNIWMK